MKRIPAFSAPPRAPRGATAWWAVTLALMIAWGCSPPPAPTSPAFPSVPSVNVAGFTIPLFASAAEQLNYARTLSADLREKSAALDLLIDRFPDEREAVGEARLELAYLHLGVDYRMASPAACRRALAAYTAIVEAFADLPTVQVKAFWYMGWIHADLLQERHQGLALYARLAREFPDDRFSRIAPVPWFKMVFPDPHARPYTLDDESVHAWAGLALLEIVRLGEGDEVRLEAFEQLWRAQPDSLATGYALRELLQRPTTAQRIVSRVAPYVQGNRINDELNRDLMVALAGHRSGEAR